MNMRASKNKTVLLATFAVLAILGLLYVFVYTLKRNVEPPPESVSMVGPAEYFNPDANPVNAIIGVKVINVGNLDLTTGLYFMDFYLTIICDRPCQPDIDILNAFSAPEVETQFTDEAGTIHAYRVRANLITNVYLENFPFDEQTLSLAIGDKHATKDDLVFIADPSYSGWDYTHLHVLGWSIRNQIDVNTVEDAYPNNLGGLYSRFTFSIKVYKPWLSSFINNLFPVLIIMLVGFLSFLFKPEAAGERLTLTSSTLVALILFHINLNSGIPPLASLTYADKFMIVNYLAVSVSIAVSAVLLVLRDSEDNDSAQRLNRWTRWAVPILWVLFLLGMTLWQFNSEQITLWFQNQI